MPLAGDPERQPVRVAPAPLGFALDWAAAVSACGALLCGVLVCGALFGAVASWAVTQVPAKNTRENTVALDFMVLETSIYSFGILIHSGYG